MISVGVGASGLSSLVFGFFGNCAPAPPSIVNAWWPKSCWPGLQHSLLSGNLDLSHLSWLSHLSHWILHPLPIPTCFFPPTLPCAPPTDHPSSLHPLLPPSKTRQAKSQPLPSYPPPTYLSSQAPTNQPSPLYPSPPHPLLSSMTTLPCPPSMTSHSTPWSWSTYWPAPPRFSPVVSHTRSWQTSALLCLLWKITGAEGLVHIHVPFSLQGHS